MTPGWRRNQRGRDSGSESENESVSTTDNSNSGFTSRKVTVFGLDGTSSHELNRVAGHLINAGESDQDGLQHPVHRLGEINVEGFLRGLGSEVSSRMSGHYQDGKLRFSPAQSLSYQSLPDQSQGPRMNKKCTANRAIVKPLASNAAEGKCPFCPMVPNSIDPTVKTSFSCSVCGLTSPVCRCCNKNNTGSNIRCRACRFLAVKPVANKAVTNVERFPSSSAEHGLEELSLIDVEALLAERALVKCKFCPVVPNYVDPAVKVKSTFCCSMCGLRGSDNGVCRCCHTKHKKQNKTSIFTGGKIRCRACQHGRMFQS